MTASHFHRGQVFFLPFLFLVGRQIATVNTSETSISGPPVALPLQRFKYLNFSDAKKTREMSILR